MSSIFLSVSVPDSGTLYHKSCDPMLIQAALRTFLFAVLGHKHLVFGGHSSIVPLILVICEELGIDSEQAVTIFQSECATSTFSFDDFEFKNYVFTPAKSTLEGSLEVLSKQMFSNCSYDAAVFIGGGDGVDRECQLFREAHPSAYVLAVKSPGGAAAMIDQEILEEDELLDYYGLFVKELKLPISRKKPCAENLKD